ncbi:MAG TPA: DUF4331 family protein [Gemmatimonadaceae bacterium]|jgi:hypothetical protein
MQFRFFTLGRRGLAVLGAAALVAATGIGVARASDHQDNPLVELNPAMDMTDVYAFPGSTPDRIVLVMNSSAFLTPAATPRASFDQNLLYQFKVDNTGDAKEDRVIQVTFKGSGPEQKVEVRGPIAPPVVGAMNNQVADVDPIITGRINQTLGSATGIQVFAGPREEPFFIDLEQFFRIVPDRKPVSGPLSMLPETPTASSFRESGAAVDYTNGFNVLSLVIELPASLLTAGGNSKIGVWGTISR